MLEGSDDLVLWILSYQWVTNRWVTKLRRLALCAFIRANRISNDSQFLCSQFWLHLRHVFFWSNQLCIQILWFSYLSNSSSSPSFCSHSTFKFTCIAIHFTLASLKQISTNFNAFKTHWHLSSQTLQNFNKLHQHLKSLTGFQSNQESITNIVIPETRLITNIPFQAQNTLLQNCFSYLKALSHLSRLSTRILIFAFSYVLSNDI